MSDKSPTMYEVVAPLKVEYQGYQDPQEVTLNVKVPLRNAWDKVSFKTESITATASATVGANNEKEAIDKAIETIQSRLCRFAPEEGENVEVLKDKVKAEKACSCHKQ